MRVAGLMSGTSLDAIDVAVIDFARAEDRGVLEMTIIASAEEPWPRGLRARIAGWLANPGASVALGDLAATDMQVGHAMADALLAVLERAGTDAAGLDLVASHGQTIHHRVNDGVAEATLQIGQPAVLAERLGCPVVADFRQRDLAAGGQGAPLVALFDALLFADPDRDVAVLNLGGIANVTVIPAGRATDAVAWDTGPANMVLDALARREGRERDADGAHAAAGVADDDLLDELLADPWFAAPPPKSTGRERFGDSYATALAGRGLATADLFATVTALTAASIARSLRDHAPAWPARVWVGGGGTRNPVLMRELRHALLAATPPGSSAPEIRGVEEAGIPSGSKEAIAFAFLGHETLHGRASSLVGATGARHPSVLGAIWPGGQGARPLDVGGDPPGGLVHHLRVRGAAQ